VNITVVGIGYVGMANAVLLSQNNPVKAYDIDSKKIGLLRNNISPIQDNEISSYLKEKKIKLIRYI